MQARKTAPNSASAAVFIQESSSPGIVIVAGLYVAAEF
jgi:hypothetical protein